MGWHQAGKCSHPQSSPLHHYPLPLPAAAPSCDNIHKVSNREESQGGERYQQAFYVFEELAQSTATSSVRSLVAQAVAELHLGRLEEAESALSQAIKTEPGYADAIANTLVLSVISGNDITKIKEYVSSLRAFLPLLSLIS